MLSQGTIPTLRLRVIGLLLESARFGTAPWKEALVSKYRRPKAFPIAPALVNQIKAVLDKGQLQNQGIELVLTGHSAGGAVACLLFCYLLTSQVLGKGSNMDRSCLGYD